MIEAALVAFDLGHELEFLAPFIGFQITLVPQPEQAEGRTRFGGGADLAAGTEWPCQRWALRDVREWPQYAQTEVKTALSRGTAREEGAELVMPLSFLCQIDLADVPRCNESALLPQSGLLSFFASGSTDVHDARFAKRVASRVLYAPEGSNLVSTPQPPTGDSHPTRALVLRPERRLYAELPWEERQALTMRTDSRILQRFEREVCQLSDSLVPRPTEECVGPMPPEGDVALARVLEHHELELYIGDASWLTFSIPRPDLAALRFESACASIYIG